MDATWTKLETGPGYYKQVGFFRLVILPDPLQEKIRKKVNKDATLTWAFQVWNGDWSMAVESCRWILTPEEAGPMAEKFLFERILLPALRALKGPNMSVRV